MSCVWLEFKFKLSNIFLVIYAEKNNKKSTYYPQKKSSNYSQETDIHESTTYYSQETDINESTTYYPQINKKKSEYY
ncbi:unnamed protein product [Rhizophagus irregularis]|nr:unnamed protein product [Rhizophagus irregularis]CAB5362515.1 unnamed protein product [Rhizophagus irregularis]